MAKRPSKASQQKALKLEAYRRNKSVSKLKRLKSASDSEERRPPLPHGDVIVSHDLCNDTVSQEDVPHNTREAEKYDVKHLARMSVLLVQLEAAVAQEGAVLQDDVDYATHLTKCARVSPAQEMILLQEEATQPQAVAQDGVTPAQDETQEGEAPSQVAAQAQAAA